MNKKRYLFITNSSKPDKKVYESTAPISPTNVTRIPLNTALKLGYQVTLGVNRKYPDQLTSDLSVDFYNMHIFRSIFNVKDNYIAYKNLSNYLKKNTVDVIHCNTPIGGLLGRILGKKYNVNKILYTAHGFHFYKGAPLVNRIIYKNVEKILAKYTDVIITMNEEDYASANKFKLRKGGKVYKIPGVGVNTHEFLIKGFDRSNYREKLGVSNDDILVLSTGDLIKRKNFETAIRAMNIVENKNVKLFICGRGPLENELKNLVTKLNLKDKVFFLGFRNDIKELLNSSDMYLFTTYQEGLPRALMEAMSAGLPCVSSKIRGNIDVLMEGNGGYLHEPNNFTAFAKSIDELSKDAIKREQFGSFNLKHISKFDVSVVEEKFEQIFSEVL